MAMTTEPMPMQDIEASVLEICDFAKRWFKITLRDHQIDWLYFIWSIPS